MAKVIKRGVLPSEYSWRYTCERCHSLIEFSSADRQSCQREEDYAACPVCSNSIDWKVIVEHGDKIAPNG